MKQDNNIIRQNIPEGSSNDLGHISSGYGNDGGQTTSDFTIPPCGIEDCDVALFNLFNSTIKWSNRSVNGQQGSIDIKKPQVIFATGERFAVAKKLRPPRDKNQVFILPAISIRRMSIEQQDNDITGRGMNQFSGDMIIKRSLSSEDRKYQNLLNKFNFKNAANDISSLRDTTGFLKNSIQTEQGALLDPSITNNILEIYTIPQPQFFTANYEVVFWTSYTQHMNYMIETLMASFLPQVRGFRLGTDKGYWFMGYVQDSYSSKDNFDDFTEEKRIIQYTFNVAVKGFLIAANGPANKVPVRKYLSAPNIVFENYAGNEKDIIYTRTKEVPPLEKETDNKFILSDIDVPAEDKKKVETSQQQFLIKKDYINPVTGKKSIKYVKILQPNQAKGETSYYTTDFSLLEEIILGSNKQ